MAAMAESRHLYVNSISNRHGLFDEDSDYEAPPPEPPKPTTTIMTTEPARKKAAPKPRKISAKREESKMKKQEAERKKESARLCREATSSLQPRTAPIIPKDVLLQTCLKALPSGPAPSPVARLLSTLAPSVQTARPRLASLNECTAAGSAERTLRHGGVISLVAQPAAKPAPLPSRSKDFVKHLRKQVDKDRTLLREKEEKFLKEDEEEFEGQEAFDIMLSGSEDDDNGEDNGDGADAAGERENAANTEEGASLESGERRESEESGVGGPASHQPETSLITTFSQPHSAVRDEGVESAVSGPASNGDVVLRASSLSQEESRMGLVSAEESRQGQAARAGEQSQDHVGDMVEVDQEAPAAILPPRSVSRLNSDSISGLFPTPTLTGAFNSQPASATITAAPAAAAAPGADADVEAHSDLHAKRRLFLSQTEDNSCQSPAINDRATPNLFEPAPSGGFVPFRGLLSDPPSRPHRILFTYGRGGSTQTTLAASHMESTHTQDNSCGFVATDVDGTQTQVERDMEASQFLDENGFLYRPPRAPAPVSLSQSLSQSDKGNMEELCSGAFPATAAFAAAPRAPAPNSSLSGLLTPTATPALGPARTGPAGSLLEQWVSQSQTQIEDTPQTPRLAGAPDGSGDEPTQILDEGDGEHDEEEHLSAAEDVLNASDNDGQEEKNTFLDDEAEVSGEESPDDEGAESDGSSVLSDISAAEPLTGLAAARRAQQQLDDDDNEASINAMMAQLKRRQKWRDMEEDDEASRARLAAAEEERREKKEKKRHRRKRRKHKKQTEEESQAAPEENSIEVVSEPESSEGEEDRTLQRFHQEEFRLKMERQHSMDALALLDESSQHIKVLLRSGPATTAPPKSPAKGPKLRQDKAKFSFLGRSTETLARAVASRGNKSSSAFVFSTGREDSNSRSMDGAPRKREASSSSSAAAAAAAGVKRTKSGGSSGGTTPTTPTLPGLAGNKFANSNSALMAALMARRH